MNVTTKKLTASKSFKLLIISIVTLLIGLSLFGLGILLGGNPLDGLAGGRQENTQEQNDLIYRGFAISVLGIVMTFISGLVVSIKLFIDSSDVKQKR